METTKDKRVKREIANSNERRRMQSINAGFQKLKRLLPVNDGEKLSKAAILQHAAEFIQQIGRERLLLHEQNTLMRGNLIQIKAGTASLDSIDLDSLPNIPLNMHIAISSTTSNNANSNCSTDNSNDDCSKEAHSNNNNNNNNTSRSSSNNKINNNNNGNNNNKEVNTKNGNNNTKEVNSSSSNSNSSKIIICSSNKNDNNNYHELAQLPIGSVTEIISDRVTSPNGLVSTGVAKAAIALPLEVPYTSETAIIHHDLHPPPSKMIKLEQPLTLTAATTTTSTTNTNSNNTTSSSTTTTAATATTTTIDPQDPPPKGQNLDTICKAIMEIEGDRVFTNENLKHETT